jgi:hypothetical protein
LGIATVAAKRKEPNDLRGKKKKPNKEAQKQIQKRYQII